MSSIVTTKNANSILCMKVLYIRYAFANDCCYARHITVTRNTSNKTNGYFHSTTRSYHVICYRFDVVFITGHVMSLNRERCVRYKTFPRKFSNMY